MPRSRAPSTLLHLAPTTTQPSNPLMPCRAPRLASPPLQTLWITDDILSEAFNRFLRVSHTHRRFGSNIPGPLEARRRLARRRLGLSAVPAAGGVPPLPPPCDFGGIFGLGVSRPPEFEKGWRWEAPVAVRRREEVGVGVRVRQEVGWGMPLFDGSIEQNIESEDASARIEQFWDIPKDPIEASANAFAKLLEAEQHKTEIEPADLQPLISFLESSSNEPDAHLTLRLTQWLTDRTTTKETMDCLLNIIRQKISLSTISLAEQSAILETLTATEDHLVPAYRLFIYSQALSLSNHADLPIKLIQSGMLNNNKIWHLFDHRAREASGVPNARNIYPKPLPLDLVKLVQEAAYVWSRSPHLRARVAYRRVWECWRFLTENRAHLTPLMSRALVRAGIANFVRARMPVPKTRVRHLLQLVGQIEGQEVKKEVDRLVFGYWMRTRNLTRYKPAGQARREKFEGEQRMGDGSVRNVGWRGRVLREAVEVRMLRGQQPGGVVKEDLGDDLGDEVARTDVSPLEPPAESDDFLYPVFGVQRHVEALQSDGEPTESTEMSTTPLEPPPKSLDSASEVEELTTLASEHRGVIPDEEEQAGEFPSVVEPLDVIDEEMAVSFRPFEAVETSFSLDSDPDDESAYVYKPPDDALETESATYFPPEETIPLPDPSDSSADAKAEVAAPTLTDVMYSPEPLHGVYTPNKLRRRRQGRLAETTDIESSRPAFTSFRNPAFRRLHGWFKHHDDAPASSRSRRDAVEFVASMKGYTWRLSALAGVSTGFRSITLEKKARRKIGRGRSR